MNQQHHLKQQQQQHYSAGAAPLDPGGPLMLQFLRYLPLLLQVATHLPGFIAGFIVAWLIFVTVVGRSALCDEYAPVAGFHLVALLLLRELFVPWKKGREALAVVRRRVATQRSFAQDVQLQWRERLD
ncbi:hypothetical protein DQ04_12831010 [Trypanosoma grayi]|uniref:hypothetical protein n=1 Tax=Trypanosoma grayi TaxID=71804 RepID=UPI0004F43B1A|nr:hypothetical protein DQ04_12831010 [Trypanosoma grayi]KEG06666.1 hypothetical protein DQ04_12831010 [Trypanosoma grayi]